MLCLVLTVVAALAAADVAIEADRNDSLARLGLLDVTKPPYSADPAGRADSTAAIQRAVNDARDRGLVCFFPEGTYLISDTISCEQQVARLGKPRHVDGGTQHYWPVHRPAYKNDAVTVRNGAVTSEEVARWAAVASAPDWTILRDKHFTREPSFEDHDAANVLDFGAKGDGRTDDTAAFVRAVAARDKVFVPNGRYLLTGTLRLRSGTRLFGLNREFVSVGAAEQQSYHGEPGPSPESNSFVLETPDDPHATPGLSFITVRGRVAWRSGCGTWMLPRAGLGLSGNGGGRFYGVMAMGRPLILSGVRLPTAFYALNVERVATNPQSEIRNCAHLRLYYFKVESGTIQRANAGDANPPCRVADSQDVRIYCMYGNVMRLEHRPMLEVVDSRNIMVSQLKAFRPGAFPHLVETHDGKRVELPSTQPCALFVRDKQ